jgi:hypothetical protein
MTEAQSAEKSICLTQGGILLHLKVQVSLYHHIAKDLNTAHGVKDIRGKMECKDKIKCIHFND